MAKFLYSIYNMQNVTLQLNLFALEKTTNHCYQILPLRFAKKLIIFYI